MRQKRPQKQVFYPFLPDNEEQVPECPLLSADGKELVPCLPEGAALENYTEKERWLYEVASGIEGHRILVDAFEEASFLLSSAKQDLIKARVRDRRGTISDLGDELPPPPSVDRKRVRDYHIILQIVCRAEQNGLETGMKDFRCNHCKNNFLLLIANQKLDRDEPDDVEAASEEPLPIIHLGFAEVQKLIDDQTVRCPYCGNDTYPFPTIPPDFD